MKKTTLAFLLVIFPMFTVPSSADIYKYIDANGQKRWTDDLSQVPPEQRTTVEQIETENDTSGQPNPVSDGGMQTEKSGPLDAKLPDTDAENETARLDREALNREQSDLNALYKELVAEKAQLEKAKSEAASAEAQEELKQKINAYNEKAKAYDQRLTRFNQKASQYNQQIRASKQDE